MKNRRNKKQELNFSNQQEREIIMSDATSTKSNTKSEVDLDGKNSHSRSIESNNFGFKKKIKIYAVYNPESHPNFYLHNKLNWYKNFD